MVAGIESGHIITVQNQNIQLRNLVTVGLLINFRMTFDKRVRLTRPSFITLIYRIQGEIGGYFYVNITIK